MSDSIESLIESWDGIGVVIRYDAETGAWIFIALHSDRLGRPTGGTRMKVYSSPSAGLRDAMRLARGMTHKWAAIELVYGGGKGVLALSRQLDSEEKAALLTRYGGLIHSLHGAFGTGPDLGTTPDDMLVIAKQTAHVHGIDREAGIAFDPGPYTALGVFAGIKAAVRHVFGSESLAGRTVHVQGVGDVGDPLARTLAKAGATVILSDLDTRRAERLAQALGGCETIEPHTAYRAACDVYAPCAIGGMLNSETIPELKCRIVAGSANNQLESSEHADALHERGILYAPDYIVNAGGAIAFGLMAHGERDRTTLEKRVTHIERTLNEILDAAASGNETPVRAAQRIVAKRLEA